MAVSYSYLHIFKLAYLRKLLYICLDGHDCAHACGNIADTPPVGILWVCRDDHFFPVDTLPVSGCCSTSPSATIRISAFSSVVG